MPLFEVETEWHIIITWASDDSAATRVVSEAYPSEKIYANEPNALAIRGSFRSRLLASPAPLMSAHTARDCLSKAAGDKVHAIRLYMHETGTDLERSRAKSSKATWSWVGKRSLADSC